MYKTMSIFKALGDTGRLRAFVAIAEAGELCACEVTALLELSNSTVSRHLMQLTQAGLIESRKDGRWILFRLARNRDLDIDGLLAWVLKRVHDDPQYQKDRAVIMEQTHINKDDLYRKLNAMYEKKNNEGCCG